MFREKKLRSYEKYLEPIPIVEHRQKVNSHIKIACILKDSTFQSLEYECELLTLDKDNWEDIICNANPSLILFETLNSIDVFENWITKVLENDNGIFAKFIMYSKQKNIPLILWETEESDFFYKYSTNIKFFDHIFTIYENNIDEYKNVLSHNNVHYLPPAVQPRIYNPINALPIPQSILEHLACRKGLPLSCSENKTKFNMHHSDIDNGKLYIDNGKREITELVDKLTLLGQREVLSKYTYTQRVDTMLKKAGLSPLIMKKAGLSPLIDLALQPSSISSMSSSSGVSILTSTNRVDSMDNVFRNYENQKLQNKELIVILNNNKMDLGEWRYHAEQYRNVKVFQIDEQLPLGRCLNHGIDNSVYDHVTKFDDDNYYAPNFLTDLMNAYKYADAEIVGKLSYYCHLEGCNVLALMCPGMENKYVNMISGSGLVIKKEVFEKVRFGDKPRGSDTVFIHDCLEQGIRMYSGDRFNYVYRRHASLDNHTWKISDEVFLKSCKFISFTSEFIPIVTI